MTHRMPYLGRLGAFLMFAGILLILLLIVVVPVETQTAVPTPPTRPEVNATQYPVDAPQALILFLAVQFVFLLIFLVSYLVDPRKMHSAHEHHLPERWYGFLHLPH